MTWEGDEIPAGADPVWQPFWVGGECWIATLPGPQIDWKAQALLDGAYL